MDELTLAQLFGPNSSQNEFTLTINKADLFGLIPSNLNTAESLLTAILLNALAEFEGNIIDENGEIITDEYGENINYDHKELYELLTVFYWKQQLVRIKNQYYKVHAIIIESRESYV